MNEKAIQHAIQRRDFGQVHFENETIFAGYSMTFHYLGNLLSKRRDFRQVPGKWPDSDERGDIMPRRFRIQFETIAGDHTTLF